MKRPCIAPQKMKAGQVELVDTAHFSPKIYINAGTYKNSKKIGQTY